MTTITFQQVEEQWPLPELGSLAELIDDRERSESMRALLDAQSNKIGSVIDCARVLFDHGFLSFDVTWGQNDVDVELVLALPKDVQTSSIRVEQGPDSVIIRLKPFSKPILDAKLFEAIDVDDSQWVVERRASSSLMKLDLRKKDSIWWTQLFKDRPSPPCQDQLSPERAWTYCQALDMSCNDPAKVFAMYKLAADCGHPMAASRVGNSYIEGNPAAGIEKDDRAALHYLMIGAENGDFDCMFQVGHAYQNGIVFEADFDKAAFWYRQAAEAGNHVRAAYLLGHLYHSFPNRRPEPEKAAYWWQRSAQQGHPDSMLNLGLYYYNGTDGRTPSKAKALDLFKKATAANSSFIELLHHNGIDLERLEAEVAAAEVKPTRSRRKRSKRASSWNTTMVWAGAAVIGTGVVLGLIWYNRNAIRLWKSRQQQLPESE